jgi:SH3-like domain-containing protein
MSARTLSALLASTLFLATSPGLLLADEPSAVAVPQVDNSKVSFAGVVNANDVYLRSGPGDNYYATHKLDKGAQLTVVGVTFDWLKVVPPDGSFSYVAKAYVEQRGDGTIGRVTKPDLNVRAGSDLNAMKTTLQTKLDDGVDVQIVGEQDEYFKIKPPTGVYLYINKQFVDPVRALPTMAAAAAGATPLVSNTPPTPAAGVADATATTQPSGNVAAAPTTQPAVAIAPSTQPSPPTAEQQFDATEAAFLDATNEPLQTQPIDDLLNKYGTLMSDDGLPVSMRRIAELRVSTLKIRAQVRDQYADTQKMLETARSKQQALKTEQQELTQRAAEQHISVYTAIGMLRTSSLQESGGTLYRLTDPGTGGTLLYIRSDDVKYAGMLDQFVGVNGDITQDTTMNLKLIAPTDIAIVDPAKVNSSVAAQIVPPSMLSKSPTVSIAGN